MSKKDNRTYWQKRLQTPLHKSYNENEKATETYLKFYEEAKEEISAEIFKLYQKINVENPHISDFYKYNRLQQLEKQIDKMILKIGKNEVKHTSSVLLDAVRVGFASTIDNLHLDFNMLNTNVIEQLINNPWHSDNFSGRIWKNKSKLINTLNSELMNGIIQGKSPFVIANMLEKRLDVGKEEARRLIRTEYLHALNNGQVEAYKKSGFTQVRVIAALDENTCKTCSSLHNQVFNMENKPNLPLHPHCRCTYAPVIETVNKTKLVDKYYQQLKEDQEAISS